MDIVDVQVSSADLGTEIPFMISDGYTVRTRVGQQTGDRCIGKSIAQVSSFKGDIGCSANVQCRTGRANAGNSLYDGLVSDGNIIRTEVNFQIAIYFQIASVIERNDALTFHGDAFISNIKRTVAN